jgi:hypothetical protein
MAAGVGEVEAKTDLCLALADRKINVRVRIKHNHPTLGGMVFSGRTVRVPAHLSLKDFDWTQSRPTAGWSIKPEPGLHYYWNGDKNCPLDLIELSTAEVIQILCGGDAFALPKSVPLIGSQKKSSPALERALAVINELYPDGVPTQAQEPNIILCRRVSKKLEHPISNDTILRAAGRRK